MKKAERRSRPTAAGRAQRVLVVDDEPDIRELLELTLVKMGLGVDAAGSIAEAKERLGDARYQLCLTDMRLPDGEGLELVRHIAALAGDLPVVDPAQLGQADLRGFTAIVVGPRAYEASAALVANNARLLNWAREGGTLVVQYGQYEMQQPGIMPYPVTINRPHDRVTVEDAPVTMLDSAATALASPNRITSRDFEGWVQDRSLYMPRTFDPAFVPLLAMNDPGEVPSRGALLVAPLGRGTYVYTTLAFFRQLPNGVPGAARLFMNLLAARARGTTQ